MYKLRDQRVKNNLQVMLEERLHFVTAAEPEHQDWFDETDKDIQDLLEKNHLLAEPDD